MPMRIWKKIKRNNSYNTFNNSDVEDKEKYAKDLLMLNLSFLSDEIENYHWFRINQ